MRCRATWLLVILATPLACSDLVSDFGLDRSPRDGSEVSEHKWQVLDEVDHDMSCFTEVTVVCSFVSCMIL